MKITLTLFITIFFANFLLTIYSMNNPLNEYLLDEIKKNNQKKVLILLQQKANPNGSDEEDLHPLSLAIDKNNISIIKTLLDHKADPYAQNFYLTSSEAYNSYLQILERVSYNFYSTSPLIEAAKKGNIDCLKMLIIDYNVDIFFIDKETELNVFEYLVDKNHLESTEMILEYFKNTDLKFFEMLLPNYFQALPESKYKKMLCKQIIECLIIRKKCKNISNVPKTLFLHIIKLSINPYSRVHKLFESKNNVLALAQTLEMENLLMQYYSLIQKHEKSEETYCLIL